MARTLEPITVGTVTPIRRLRALSIQAFWDDSVVPAQTRLTATFDYEVIYTDPEGKQVVPSKPDGYLSVSERELGDYPEFREAFETISAVADSLKEAQQQPRAPRAPA